MVPPPPRTLQPVDFLFGETMKKAETANFPEFEAEMLKVWEKENTFQQSLDNRKGGKRFSFYDGPPFANGMPHYGHVVAITEKDSVTRYKTMRGYYVPRRNGWDTHGLPVEYELEKQLGISGKRQIQEMGIDKFNEAARASVFKYKEYWEEFMTRMGRWADKDSYATLDDSYIESVWWVLGQLHKKGLVYRGFRSNPYCPRCATPLSNFEVNQNYKDNTPDPSVYVKFELPGHKSKKSLLAWTTTPWTLPANAALAVSADADYVEVELLDNGDSWEKGESLILAKDRLSVLDLKKAEYKVTNTVKGMAMVEALKPRYTPLYQTELTEREQEAAYQVYVDESVSLEDGTGILHVAPRYGETDLALGLREDLPLIESVDGNGIMTDKMGDFAGKFFKEADSLIIEDLTKRGFIFAAETFEHTYPFCWRCETPLMYFAMPSWFVKVTSLREKLVKNNDQITWVPAHIKQGRFGNWLADARDWNISRNRFWGAPIPIWINEADEEDILVVGSMSELRELSGHEGDFDLHRPGVDEVVIKKNGKTYRRTEEVFDCWFESGSMPYAQDHYPFEKKDDFEETFPAQFIAEGLDQTRGWFYTLHVLGTALFDKPAFENVIVHGLVLAADGKKLSKRLRNYPEPSEIFEGTGADSLRFFLMSSSVENGEDVRFSYDAVNEVTRNVFSTLWNVYSFLSTYAEVCGWQPEALKEPEATDLMDRWILSRLNETVIETTKHADKYQLAGATRPLRDLIDDLSNWYVRRNRRRFWKNESQADRDAAFAVLHYVLVRTAQLLAPWAPFISDKLWLGLTEGMDVPTSVHLSDWPIAGKVDSDLLKQMNHARQVITEGLSQRAAAGIKVRQPLAKISIPLVSEELQVIVAEEVNVKEVDAAKNNVAVKLDTKITQELMLEGLARDIIRSIQAKRKENGMQVSDQVLVKLGVQKGVEVSQAAQKYSELIESETSSKLELTEPSGDVPVRIGGESVTISISKA